MKRINDHIRDHIHNQCGCNLSKTDKSYREIVNIQWNAKFIQLMRNRCICGGPRYGLNNDPNKDVDFIASIRQRLRLYEDTGNTEYLVDVANGAMLEFGEGLHPNKHFKATDDGHHFITKEKD